MSFNFADTRVTATSPVRKTPEVLAVKLTSSDFTTGGAASVKAVLPQDASIIGFRYWTKTAFSGNGVTALSLSVGVTGTATKYLNSGSITLTAGAGSTTLGAGSWANIFQDAGVETGDQSLMFTGTATTGNPTAGEAIVLIEYIR
jgi:hypothetical protein